MDNAKCVVCKVADAMIRKTGPDMCLPCIVFFKKFNHQPLKELPQAEDCTGSCFNVRKCKQCRMKQYLAIESTWRNIHSQKSKGLSQSFEKTPKEKIQYAQKEQSSSGKKSKLSLKSSRQLQLSGGMSGSLDKWAAIKTEETKKFINSPEKIEKNVENQESDVKVPCVASLHNLGNTCFLNSVLQVLRYTPQFEEKLSELAHEIKLSKKERELIAQLEQEDSADDPDKDIATWDVVTNLSEVFSKMKQAEENVVNGSCFIGTRPYDLIDTIGHLNPVFEGDQQQDAHELLRCLLAYIQDASRSVNRYRSKAAESLGRCMGKCAVEDKSVLASPKEVDLFGGSKSSPNQNASSKKSSAKHSTSGTKQISAGGPKDENSDVCKGTKLQTSACVRNSHEHKLLTELQNHNLTGPKSVMNCCKVKNDKSRISYKNVFAGEENAVAGYQKFSKLNKRPIAKRKICHCCEKKDTSGKSYKCMMTETTKGCTIVAQKKRRFCSADKDVTQTPVIREGKQIECIMADVLGTSTPDMGTLLTANNSKNCSKSEKHQEQKQIDNKCLPEEKGLLKRSTCLETSKKTSEGNPVKANPVLKELFVRLDKNGIDRYFKKLSKPQSLSDIKRHINPVADCVEELFQGCVELWTRCCECEKVTTRQEDYQDISVAIEQKQPEEEEEEEEQVQGKKADMPAVENSEELLKHEDAWDLETAEKPDSSLHLDKDISISGFVKVLRSSSGKGSAKVEDFTWIKKSLEEVEHLRDDSKYWCDSCCHLTEAERSMHYMSVPKVLTIHLKRFAVLNGSHRMFTKLTHHMPLPMLLPCIEDNCLTPEEHRLLLYGVIMHTGSTLSGGHYTAYVRAPVGSPGLSHQSLATAGNQNTEKLTSNIMDNTDKCHGTKTTEAHQYTDVWFACDDDVIKILPEREFVSLLNQGSKYTMSPYLLFYHRL